MVVELDVELLVVELELEVLVVLVLVVVLGGGVMFLQHSAM